MKLYTLRGHAAIPTEDVLEWARWFGTHTAERVVAQEYVGNVMVSTVFLGIDSFGYGPPKLYETMVMSGPLEGIQQRYTRWEQAEAGHKKIVADVAAASAMMKEVTSGRRAGDLDDLQQPEGLPGPVRDSEVDDQ